MEECKYCSKSQVVPVLDEETEQLSRPGNKFRRFCLACGRWLPMCSAKYFRSHPNPHVLPIGETEIIPISESEETQPHPVSDLPDRDADSSDTSRLTDGGHRAAQDREYRNEILLECVFDLVLEGIVDKEPAIRYLSQQFRE